jgi:hypothetical protein
VRLDVCLAQVAMLTQAFQAFKLNTLVIVCVRLQDVNGHLIQRSGGSHGVLVRLLLVTIELCGRTASRADSKSKTATPFSRDLNMSGMAVLCPPNVWPTTWQKREGSCNHTPLYAVHHGPPTAEWDFMGIARRFGEIMMRDPCRTEEEWNSDLLLICCYTDIQSGDGVF